MKHVPVLLEEVLEYLQLKPGDTVLDGTLGYGGHAEALLKSVKGKVAYIGLDRDEEAIIAAKKRLSSFKNVKIYHSSYGDAKEVLDEEGIELVDAILLDLGASSPQFDSDKRGFSFKSDAPLDMRFDISQKSRTAADIVNTYPQKDIALIIKRFGEERYANQIARAIVQHRSTQAIESTQDLAGIVAQAIPKRFWPKKIHPATKTFQALRIEVNRELEILKKALPELITMLKPGGRIVVISFHSLEDRIVKETFRYAEKECICPKDFPVCRCEKNRTVKIITKKPLVASKTEIKNNVRSRSAKMRVSERL